MKSLNEILQGSEDQRDKITSIKSFIDDAIANNLVQSLFDFVDTLVMENVPLIISRPGLFHFSQLVENLPSESKIDVLKHSVNSIKPKVRSFEDTDAKLRELLGTCLTEAEDYVEAARVLAGIDFENGRYTDAQKAEFYIRIAELFLEEDETVDAERYVNRAAQSLHHNKDPVVQVRHKVCYARILDSKRKFLDAGQRYYQLSIEAFENQETVAAEEDLLHLLVKAMTCAILANAGPQRNKLLSLLYKDPRSKAFPTHFEVMRNMYMGRILAHRDVVAFEKGLEAHQKAILGNGSTVLERAVIEHNMVAVSLIYSTISFAELSILFGEDESKVLHSAISMIQEGRMHADIDEIEGFLYFKQDVSYDAGCNRCIADLCHSVSKIYDEIQTSRA